CASDTSRRGLWRWFSRARLSASSPSLFMSASVRQGKSPNSGRIVRSGAFRTCRRTSKIDGQTVANIVQGRRYDHRIPTGRHVLTLTAVPNIVLSYPTSITVNVRPGGTYIFTALWDSDQVHLRPTTLSPAEMAKMGL